MNTNHISRKIGAAAVIALIAQPLWAGVVFEVETTWHSGPDRGPETSEMSVEGSNLKMEIPPGDSGAGKDVAIWRGDRREMVFVDHRDKAYMVIDSSSAKDVRNQIGSQMQQAMKEVEKHMEGLDPKQREMMQEMLKGKMPPGAASGMPTRPTTEFRRTGERAKKAGYPCVRYDVLRDGEKIQELWVTDWDNVEGGEDAKDVFKDMNAFFEELGDSFGGAGFGDGQFDTFEEVNGFPVVTRDFDDGSLESETTLRSARRQTLDPDAFEPPSGYKRRTMLGAP
ncbi:MAG: DUF4412 domain-containing protein [Gammaproteobacteria bacterium]|nr:DUF4412 domain-containing protein [Gammaproteobacteria bacterium]NNF61261.1 hypothetical protein [Gammaproteobacteria bacterium]NNM21707.1 hypothetical protein [Gammaproteobacteria bacterium]